MRGRWKMLAALAAAGAGAILVTPGAVRTIVPLLFVLACPLSMLFMMGSMGRGWASRSNPASSAPGQEEEIARLESRVAELKVRRGLLALAPPRDDISPPTRPVPYEQAVVRK